MVEKHPHLSLLRSVNFTRKKKGKGFGYEKADRDAEKFYQTEIQKLNFIGDAYKKDKEKYHKYFDPNLIFKIKLTGKSVSDEFFRDELRRAGIKTISSAPNKLGYWVAFTDDAEFKQFRQKLETRLSKDTATFVDLIDGIEEVPPEEKLSESLKEKPLAKGKPEYLDVEIWRMEDSQLKKFTSGLSSLIEESHGEISDTLVTDNFCVLRIKCDDELLSKITELREISHVDRPPQVDIEKKLDVDIEKLKVKGSPDKNKPGILIVDSGIRSHPLLENAIADRIVLPSSDGKIKEELDIDDVGHGTAIAGIALYGDVNKCVEVNEFDPQVWLYSAKIMYRGDDGNAVFDEKSLLEHQLKDAIEKTIEKHTTCKIVNVSLGNSARKMTSGQRQFRIASLIDELSNKHHDILFTIAAGNNVDDVDDHESYPHYLMDDTPRAKIIDPATSVHGMTVGSIYSFKQNKSENLDFPSPFTCVGPGLRGMIKPELVDYGGGHSQDLVTVNPGWVSEGRLFTLERGTSFSAPKIAYCLAILKDAFPDASRNFLKALLLSSAVIPLERPSPLDKINLCGNNRDLQNILNIYGYGKPDLDRALYSESNRVLLTYDGEIGLNRVELFTINLPEEFLKVRGKRAIEVTLTFDPPTNSNRSDYLGIIMEYHLFRNSPVENIRKSYEQTEIDNESENIVPEEIKNKEIKMLPGINLRKKGAHQKSIKEYQVKPQINTTEPLILAVVCQKKWFDKKNYKQPYSVIVTFRHRQDIDLYNMIKLKNRARARAR